MKRICGLAIAASALVGVAAAQDDLATAKLRLEKMAAEAKLISVEGGVMGPAVKSAPYSADEVHETTQTLGDGTRIQSESKTSVYRDSEGRVRRETPEEISIWDPVAGTQYVLNPKTMKARKMGVNMVVSKTGTTADGQIMLTLQNDLRDKAKAIAEAKAGGTMVLADSVALRSPSDSKRESLGTQVMEGVTAEGVRVTSTIPQGAIGNDRAIQSTTERWYSQELHTNILTRRNDPRTGENIVKLTNIHRGEPSPVLFEVPPGYTLLGK